MRYVICAVIFSALSALCFIKAHGITDDTDKTEEKK